MNLYAETGKLGGGGVKYVGVQDRALKLYPVCVCVCVSTELEKFRGKHTTLLISYTKLR